MLSNFPLTPQNKILLVSLVVFATLYFVLNSKTEAPKPETKATNADTFIPKGQVLVPTELANAEAVAGLIDQFGIVDLYFDSNLVAERAKLLRAPLNKNQYAVMVSETLSREIMKYKGPFTAVVQNRYSKEEKPKKMPPPKPLEKTYVQTRVEIEYYQGEK